MDKQHILEKTAANCLMSVIQNAWRFTKCFVIVLMRQKKKSKDTKQPQETELQQMPVTAPSQRLLHHPTGGTPNYQNSILVTEETACCPWFPKCFTATSVIHLLSRDFVFTTQCYTLTERISMKWKLEKPDKSPFSTACLWSFMIITPKQTRVTVVSKFNFF